MKLKETINLITEAGLANWDEKCPTPRGGGVIPYNRLMGMCSQMGSHFHSLRSKRFQLSQCAKVRAGAFLFFCSRPDVLDELARKRLLRRLAFSRLD